jgi:hypothetical protein
VVFATGLINIKLPSTKPEALSTALSKVAALKLDTSAALNEQSLKVLLNANEDVSATRINALSELELAQVK